MPIYEYACTECGNKFDQLVKMSAPEPPCPKCGRPTRKLVSAAGFILKGGGWYKDHYGLKKSSGSGESSGSSSGESSAKAEAPAAKSEAAKPASTPASTTATAAAK